MKTKKILRIMMTVPVICILASLGAWAEDDTVNFGNRNVTEDDIIGVFYVPKSRAIRPVKTESKYKSISMEITFELNSHQLTQKACKILDSVGRAINNDSLKDVRFIIEGHTDASGPEPINRALSRNRAQAVKDYLVDKAGVSPDRLRAVGKGEGELLFTNRPYAPENRRVKFIANGN